MLAIKDWRDTEAFSISGSGNCNNFRMLLVFLISLPVTGSFKFNQRVAMSRVKVFKILFSNVPLRMGNLKCCREFVLFKTNKNCVSFDLSKKV